MRETIVFGGGCFWCTEAVFKMLKGVLGTTPGYAGGTKKDPTYEEVCTGETGHAEVLRIEYDPGVISLEKLLEVFFEMHDPTSKDRQGEDMGSQYRSIVLCSNDAQKGIVANAIEERQKVTPKRIVTEVEMLEKFYPAEERHKDYFDKNPLQPYCLFAVRPKVAKVRKRFPDIVK